MTKKTSYYMYILNIVSCIAVVLLHTSLLVFNVDYSSKWIHAVTIQAFNIFAVPIFFMISGANLLGYRERYSTKKFFTKRFSKIGIALLGGSIVCYLVFALFPQYFFAADQIAQSASIKDFIKRFLTNQINDIYWFLYSIIYLYMLTPILSRIVEYRRTLEYVIVTLGVVSIGLPCWSIWVLISSTLKRYLTGHCSCLLVCCTSCLDTMLLLTYVYRRYQKNIWQ